jgi:hypothetical protein
MSFGMDFGSFEIFWADIIDPENVNQLNCVQPRIGSDSAIREATWAVINGASEFQICQPDNNSQG